MEMIAEPDSDAAPILGLCETDAVQSWGAFAVGLSDLGWAGPAVGWSGARSGEGPYSPTSPGVPLYCGTR
jgi:hypothetical protein